MPKGLLKPESRQNLSSAPCLSPKSILGRACYRQKPQGCDLSEETDSSGSILILNLSFPLQNFLKRRLCKLNDHADEAPHGGTSIAIISYLLPSFWESIFCAGLRRTSCDKCQKGVGTLGPWGLCVWLVRA